MVFLLLLGISILILLFSKIRIEIQNLTFSSEYQKHFNKSYQIKCKLKILDKITIAQVTITNQKLKKWKIKEKAKEMEIKAIQNQNKIDKKILEAIKQANIQFKKVNLKMELGTENASLTSFLVPAISTVIAILLRKKIKDYENQTFILQPIYQNRNFIKIYFSGIFEIKMVHIINIIYILNKKGSVRKYERTSHRVSYDYSYE